MLRCTKYSNRKSCKSDVVFVFLELLACMCEVLEWGNAECWIEKKFEGDTGETKYS